MWAILLHPRELMVPGKTGGYDQAAVLDTHPWLHDFLTMLTLKRVPTDRLWPHSPQSIILGFNQAVEILGLSHLHLCRYSLRHGGASHDFLSGLRPIADVKNRGHWMSDMSIQRYTKPARALRELARMDPLVVKYGKKVADNLSKVFHREISLLPPKVPTRPFQAPGVKKKKSSP